MRPWDDNFTTDSKVGCTMFAGHDLETDKDDIVYLAVNPYWSSIFITLPALPKGFTWHLAVDTADYINQKFTYAETDMKMVGREYWLGARSVAVLIAKEIEKKSR